MRFVPYVITLALLGAVAVSYRLQHVHKDARTNAHKTTRLILLWITILGILGQRIQEEVKEYKRSETDVAWRKNFQTLNDNVEKLQSRQSEILAVMATNTAIAPKLRLEILEHSRAVELVGTQFGDELEKWKIDLKNELAEQKQKADAERLKYQIQRAEQTAIEQAQIDQTWSKASQCYSFLIQTFQSMIKDIANKKGEKVFSDYVGLPKLTLGGQPVHIAKITTGFKLGWSFEISAEAILRNNGAEVYLRVSGSCTNYDEKIWFVTMVK